MAEENDEGEMKNGAAGSASKNQNATGDNAVVFELAESALLKRFEVCFMIKILLD